MLTVGEDGGVKSGESVYEGLFDLVDLSSAHFFDLILALRDSCFDYLTSITDEIAKLKQLWDKNKVYYDSG